MTDDRGGDLAAEPTFLGSLEPHTARALASLGRARRYPRGSTIFLEGDSSEHVVLISTGSVKVSYLTEDGREVVLAIREAGSLLGDLSAIDGEPRSATATAIDDVEALVVDATAFSSFLAEHPRAAVILLRMLSRRLRDADRKRIEFGATDTVGRVAARLVEMATRFGEPADGGITIATPLTQDELASWVGSSRKGVTNALQTLRERGLIDTGRKRIIVRDLEGLRARAR